MQRARDFGSTFPARALVRQVGHGIERDHVHQSKLAAQQPHDAVEFIRSVVDAFDQRPLVLDRIPRGTGIALARFHQILRVKARGARQQLGAQIGFGRVQRQRQRRLDLLLRQALEHAFVAHRGKHQVLVRDVARRAQQITDCP